MKFLKRNQFPCFNIRMDRALNRNTCKLAAAVHTEQYATTPSYIGASDIIKEQLNAWKWSMHTTTTTTTYDQIWSRAAPPPISDLTVRVKVVYTQPPQNTISANLFSMPFCKTKTRLGTGKNGLCGYLITNKNFRYGVLVDWNILLKSTVYCKLSLAVFCTSRRAPGWL